MNQVYRIEFLFTSGLWFTVKYGVMVNATVMELEIAFISEKKEG